MKTNSPAYSDFTALSLKVVGLMMLVSAVFDYIMLAIPFNIGQTEWQLSFIGQMVDQGVRPLVGLCLLSVGYWIANRHNDPKDVRFQFRDIRFWGIILASVLGLFYLLFVPVHLNNVRVATDQALQQIAERASQADLQVQQQVQQIESILKNDNQYKELEQALASGQVQGEQLTRLQGLKQQIDVLKQNPQALNQQLEQTKTRLATDRKNAEDQARSEAVKLGVRTGVTSLLLAIAYALVSWTGLKTIRDGQNS
ncbi:MAG: hypothetical protein HC916_05530 [Coleofasciculaceae cyanobacterium SM2_1_6]|nr:hypothetical protein [Coleofasciculaceae cyanobacterium SM2_1_6]